MEQPKGDYSRAASHARKGAAPGRFAMVSRVCVGRQAPSPPCSPYHAVAHNEICLAFLAILTGGHHDKRALNGAGRILTFRLSM